MINQEKFKKITKSFNLMTSDEYETYISAVASKTEKILRKTLGPYAKTTVLDDGVCQYPTKDGWNILKRLHSKDRVAQSILQFIIRVSERLNDKVGDGTTTAIDASCRLINTLNRRELTKTFRQNDIIEVLNNIREEVNDTLLSDKYSYNIDLNGDFEDIKKIAFTSSNSNETISNIIQEIYKKTRNPNIQIKISADDKLSYEIQTGYKLDGNAIKLEYYRNTDDGSFIDKNINYVAMFNHNVTFADHYNIISTMASFCNARRTSLIIIAPYFDNTFLSMMIQSFEETLKKGSIPNLILFQIANATQLQKNYLEDFSIITNSKIFNPSSLEIFDALQKGDNSENYHKTVKLVNDMFKDSGITFSKDVDIINKFLHSYLGQIDSIIVEKKAIVVDIKKTPRLEKHREEIFNEWDQMQKTENSYLHHTNEYNNLYLRVSKLSGNMGMIRVGGNSLLEKECLKDWIEDSVRACKAAFENSYVRGLNITTLTILIEKLFEKHIDKINLESIKEVLQPQNNENLIEVMYKLCNQKLSKDEIKKLILNESYRTSYTSEDNNTNWKDKKDLYVKKIILLSLIEVFVGVDMAIFYNKFDNEKEFLKDEVYRILATAISSQKGFNLITETFESHTDNTLSVVNPSITDSEVLSAMISIVSFMITSDQMVSLNIVNNDDVFERQLDYDREKINILLSTAHKFFPNLGK